jgi:hypothetical protein
MTTKELKTKSYAAIEINQQGHLSDADTKLVVCHLYDIVQEMSDDTLSYNECGDMTLKSDADLDRSEMHQTLRQLGI